MKKYTFAAVALLVTTFSYSQRYHSKCDKVSYVSIAINTEFTPRMNDGKLGFFLGVTAPESSLSQFTFAFGGNLMGSNPNNIKDTLNQHFTFDPGFSLMYRIPHTQESKLVHAFSISTSKNTQDAKYSVYLSPAAGSYATLGISAGAMRIYNHTTALLGFSIIGFL